MKIVEEQHCRLEEARLNLTTPLTSEVEASEPEIHGEARPKTTSRPKLASVASVHCLRRPLLQLVIVSIQS